MLRSLLHLDLCSLFENVSNYQIIKNPERSLRIFFAFSILFYIISFILFYLLREFNYYMLPNLLLSRFRNILWDDYKAVLENIAKNRKWSLRINFLKASEKTLLEEFSKLWIVVQKFSGIDGAFIFEREYEYKIKGTRAFYDGKIYMQSIASMLPVLVLDPIFEDIVLDVCAAPGSKTTQLAMIMKNTGKIYAIEQNHIRYEKLLYNCLLQWTTNVEWIRMDARHWLSYKQRSLIVTDNKERMDFDRILLDVPCSAEGRILIDNAKTYWFWSIDNIHKKAAIQYELLEASFARLKRGGTMVYSTCTLAPEENEWVISYFLSKNEYAILEDIDIGLSDRIWWKSWLTSFGKNMQYDTTIEKTVRILPSEETEWFFMAKIRKL